MLEVRICEVRLMSIFIFSPNSTLIIFQGHSFFKKDMHLIAFFIGVEGDEEEYKHINLTGTYSLSVCLKDLREGFGEEKVTP